MVPETPPRALSAIHRRSPASSIESSEAGSEDSFAAAASIVQAEETESVAAASAASSSTTRRGIDLFLKKQLIDDINQRGGLLAVDTAALCDERPDQYGDCLAFPSRQKAVIDLVGDWRRRPQGFRNVLNKLAELDQSFKEDPQTPAFATRAKKPNSSSNKRSSRAKPQRRTPRTNQSPRSPAPAAPPEVIRMVAQQIPFDQQPEPITNMAFNNNNPAAFLANLRLRASNQGNVRAANTVSPEANGGVVSIFPVTDIPNNGDLRTAYCLSLTADIRYVPSSLVFCIESLRSCLTFLFVFNSYAQDPNFEWYRAYVLADREVAVQYPALPYSDLLEPTAIERGRTLANDTNDRRVQSEAILRNALLADQDRQLATMVFTFPQQLDNNVLSPNPANNRINFTVIPEVPAGGQPPTRAKVYFTIAVFDNNPPRINAPAAAGQNPMANMLQGMNLNNNNNNNGMNP